MTYKTVLSRALAAGAVAAVLFGSYLYLVVEPTIDDAIALEEQEAADPHEHESDAAHSHGEDAMFTRSEQVGGGVAAGAIYALVLAVVLGTVYAALRHRLPGGSDLPRAAWLAAVSFGAVAFVPALKYPPNPPAVGDPDTVGERTVLYLALIATGIVLVSLVTRLSGILRNRLDDPTRIVVVAVVTVVAFGLAVVVFPANPDAIDPSVPAGLVWDFRIRSVVGLALLFASVGLGLGWLLERDVRADVAPERTAVPA
jgi:predicted cobalt transporter CbtA